MSRFDWQLNFLSVHACKKKERGHGMEARTVASFESAVPEEDEVLESLVDSLLLAAFKKKPDTGTSSACRAYSFLDTDSGRADRKLLATALETETQGLFDEVALDLASRYSDLPEANPALLLFMRARITTPADIVLPFFVMFACDFDEVSVLTGEKQGLLDRIGEAVGHRLRKALIYPMLDAGMQDMSRLVLYQASSSEGFDEMVALEVPKTTPELVAQELKAALDKRVQAPDYDKYFREPPPAARELFGEERYVNLEHLLPMEEARHISDLTFQSSKEKLDKEIKLRISIDDFGRFEARLDHLNRDFFFARRGEDKYLIVRAEKFVTKDQLSAVEFMEVDELERVLSKMLD
ncbi:MAG: DUF3900 domain-containing protein [Candidatus Wallbacteria bacterium]|nr:DUF3900 domain-containing protein [Candidatus Wallbacteria bacterium]